MNLELTETRQLVAENARTLAMRDIFPAAAEMDRQGSFPHAQMRALASAGLLGVNVPESLGGSQAGVVAYSLAMQEVARACASTAVTMAVTNMVAEVIATFGTESQRTQHVPALCNGHYAAGAFALSEPGAGSDRGSMSTTARETDDGYCLTGEKQWITSGDVADIIVVWARTSKTGTRGISCFLVPKDTPGLRVGKKEDKLGLRASSTVSLSFDDCRLAKDALLGEEGQGFRIAMMALDGGRIGIASQALGIGRAAFEEACSYSKQRKQFGKALAEFQATQFKLADMDTALGAARQLTLRAATLKERGERFSTAAAMAKLFASEAAFRVCDENVQLHGGLGYVRDVAAERHLRDVRVTRIYEGTSEVQRKVIARSALLHDQPV